jgi:hypothetical protein
MTFEFMGADLETEEGRNAFANVYDAVMLEEGTSEDFLEIGYSDWVQKAPDKALDFLTFCERHNSEHVREHAVYIALEVMKHQPEPAYNSLMMLLEDDNQMVQGSAIVGTKELLAFDSLAEERKALGLMKLNELVATYNFAKKIVEGPADN